jgi:bifunctional non-homologous end joining protein LigD
MALETYRQKRNFARTAEPRGRQSRRKGHAFVVQKHDARSLHYDFRLELGGVLLSWAVPKGPSLDPKVKRLAMQTEDHPLEYGDFEGVIPEGEYGGGTVLLWDRGTWQPDGDAEEMYRRGRLSFVLEGEKLHGKFHLVRTPGGKRSADARRWLLFKSNDAAASPGSDAAILEEKPRSVASDRDLDAVAEDPDHVWTSKASKASQKPPARAARARAAKAGQALERNLARAAKRAGARRAALPDFIEPELATLTSPAPEGDEWLHEIKLDGYRILARIEDGRARLASRRGHDWTRRLPSVASALDALPIESGWLDGEVVVFDGGGVSSFQSLQNSLDAGKDAACVYVAFDAPFLNGVDLRPLPLVERKAMLRELLQGAPPERVRFSDHIQGGGAAFFEQACRLGLEGIVCKRADSPYRSGRGRTWLKVKCLARQEFVIGGFTEPSGARGHLGALLLGVREHGALVYAGKVGTGFTQASLAELASRLRPLERATAPFENPPRGARRGVHWVEPRLVAEVAFTERTRDGLIRHPSFQGLRDDKAAKDVHLERPQALTEERAPKRPARKARPAAAASRAQKPRAKRAVKAVKAAPISLDVSRLEITNPDRVLFPEPGITKRELMMHYARVATWMLPHVIERPLMVVRCPEGVGEQCFHQKHPSRGMPKSVATVSVPQKKGPEDNLMIRDVEGLLGLVQMGALEIHTWGCRADHLDAPDQLVFDLDPDEGLPWARVREAAYTLRSVLGERGLTPFLRTTGGKGLHLVVPVAPTTPWPAAKQFSKRIVDELVRAEPGKYVSNMAKQKRKGKIFLDYLRNGPGATAVCAYSTRARAGAPVAVPVGWEELDALPKPDPFNVQNLERRLKSLEDPWASFDDARAPIDAD